MTKENDMNENPEAAMQEARPNRDEYSKMWAEDNNDVNFEDKEARYGRAIEDRKELRDRRKADAGLSDLFDRHDWLAIMAQELRDNPDINVFEWLEGFCNENDLSIQEVLDNPEAKKRLAEKMANRKAEQAKSEQGKQEITANLQKSYDTIAKESGKSPEEVDELWLAFWKVVEDAEKGIVSTKTIQDFAKSLSYDEDVKAAEERGGMRARNEKIQNNVRKPSQEMASMPPTLNQGASAPTKKETPKKKSFTQTMFEDL